MSAAEEELRRESRNLNLAVRVLVARAGGHVSLSDKELANAPRTLTTWTSPVTGTVMISTDSEAG